MSKDKQISIENSKGMVIDGPIGTYDTDSSGERLDVEGADISSLPKDGVLNIEHADTEKQGFSSVIGKCIYAKKILTKADVTHPRELYFWKKLESPFIYAQFRLFDGSGHDEARSAAAIIRDTLAHNEPVLIRYSVEGSTLEKEGNVLKKTVIRRVAATIKPCNKATETGVLIDPNNPNLQNDSEFGKRESDPEFAKLGKAYDNIYNPEDALELDKAMTVGVASGAPGGLTDGAALSREWIGNRGSTPKKKRTREELSKDLVAAAASWDGKKPFRQHLGDTLSDVDGSVLDHFTELTSELHVKKAETEMVASKQPPSGMNFPPVPDRAANPALGVSTNPKSTSFIDESGVLHTEQGQYRQKHPNTKAYHAILHPNATESKKLFQKMGLENHSEVIKSTVHDPWERAMSSWMTVNKMLRTGKVSEPVLFQAAMHSAMSPNTSVPQSELYFGYIQDLQKHFGLNPNSPMTRELQLRLRRGVGSGQQLPEFERPWYQNNLPNAQVVSDPKHLQNVPKKELKAKPQISANGRESGETPQEMMYVSYNNWHPHNMALMTHYGPDVRGATAALMAMKNEKGDHPSPRGAGSKLARFMYTMAGAGNGIVPDRHMIRDLYGLNVDTDKPVISHITNTITADENSHLLDAIDHHFFNNHPAVKYVLNRFPEHFKDDPEQAIFPAFWLNWLTIGHHEKMRGMPYRGFQGATDHYPFWASIKGILDKHQIPHADAGVPLHKSELEPLVMRTAGALRDIESTHGTGAASLANYAYLIPALLRHHEHLESLENPTDIVNKWERSYVDFKLAVESLRKSEDDAPLDPENELKFNGQTIKSMGKLFKLSPNKVADIDKPHHIIHSDYRFDYAVPATPGNKTIKDVKRYDKMIKWKSYSTQLGPHARDIALGKITASSHGVPEFNTHPDQNALLEGLDIANHEVPEWYKPGVGGGHNFWTKNDNDDLVYIKNISGHHGDSQYFSPVQEMLFHNIARDFWGAGKRLSTTALFKHPVTGDYSVAIKAIPNAKHLVMHFADNKTIYGPLDLVDHINSMRKTGELDKLAMMDYVMGNEDRGANNMAWSPVTKKLHLFDHGFYNPSTEVVFPEYLDIGDKPMSNHVFSPNAQNVLDQIDFPKLLEQLDRYPINKDAFKKQFQTRIAILRDNIANKGHWDQMFKYRQKIKPKGV